MLELPGGRGWLRTPRVYLDFRFVCEFNATPETDAVLSFHVWLESWSPRTAYRFRIPTRSTENAVSLVTTQSGKVTPVTTGPLNLRAGAEWQQLEISSRGRQVTIVLNGSVLGVFDVEHFGGHLMLETRKGLLRLRNLSLVETNSIDTAVSTVLFEELAAQIRTAKAEGVRLPQLTHQPRPNYTPEAMERKVEGLVNMEVVVLPDGAVGPVRVIRSLDPDLDRAAVATVKTWRFSPGQRSGKSIAVLVEVEMTFTLR